MNIDKWFQVHKSSRFLKTLHHIFISSFIVEVIVISFLTVSSCAEQGFVDIKNHFDWGIMLQRKKQYLIFLFWSEVIY